MRYLTVFLAILTGQAYATPPNIVNFSDTYLGANEDQVFLLRSLYDNLGRHYPEALDIYLIARSRQGDKGDEVWPVRRKINYIASLDEPDEVIEIPDSVDPFQIMSDREAWPWAMQHTHGLAQIRYEDGTLVAVMTSLEGWERKPLQTEFRMTISEAVAQIVHGHTATRAVLEQVPGMNGGTDSIYYFHPDTFAQECLPQASGYLRGQDREVDTLLIAFDCIDAEEEYVNAQVFLVIPASQSE